MKRGGGAKNGTSNHYLYRSHDMVKRQKPCFLHFLYGKRNNMKNFFVHLQCDINSKQIAYDIRQEQRHIGMKR